MVENEICKFREFINFGIKFQYFLSLALFLEFLFLKQCGEAHSIFLNNLKTSSIHEIYINFPDPPIWDKSKQRLIDQSFLTQVILFFFLKILFKQIFYLKVHRVLKKESPLVIVTDDHPYCQTISNEIHELSSLYEEFQKKKNQFLSCLFFLF